MIKRAELKEHLLKTYKTEEVVILGAEEGQTVPKHKYIVIEDRIILHRLLDAVEEIYGGDTHE